MNARVEPVGWKMVELREVADIFTSNVDKKTLPGEVPVRLCNYMDVYSNNTINGDIDFMRATATRAEIERFRLSAGDVLITKDSETPTDIAVPALVVEAFADLLCGYHLAVVRPAQAVDPRFLTFLLRLPETNRHFRVRANGSTRYGLTLEAIRSAPLTLPPAAEQRRIAEILDTIDEAIRRTEQVIAKLQQMKQGLLHDLLTRGIDEHGELRDPDACPHDFQHVDLGLRPRGWSERSLRDLADFINGFAFKPEHWKSVGLPIIRIAQLTDPHAPCDHYPGRLADHYRVDSGDLVFSWSATLTTRIWDRGPAYLNQHLFKVVPSGDTNTHFLHYLLDFHMDALAGQAHGTTMKHIKRSDLLPFRVLVPPGPEQVAIARIARAHDEVVDSEQTDLQKLRLLKSGLMADLLMGRVRVPVLEEVPGCPP